jgi:putative oxidoreductase
VTYSHEELPRTVRGLRLRTAPSDCGRDVHVPRLAKGVRVLGEKSPTGSQFWVGGLIELSCGAAIALGLVTSLAAFLASGEMAVAYIPFHWKLQFDSRFFPIVNRGELPVLYCFVFLYVACRGSRPWALDDVLRRRSGVVQGSTSVRARSN